MNAGTRNEGTVREAAPEASWASRLSLRPSSQFDDGPSLPHGPRPGANLVRTVALFCALALSAVALGHGQPEGSALAKPAAAGVAGH